MPLVAHIDLPTFNRLRDEGEEILASDRASTQDIRELHIGLLNMMPDAALEATERQFFRLVGACNQIVQFHVHPFTISGLTRSPEAQAHIDKYYEPFEKIKQDGLDALIISGANVIHNKLPEEDFSVVISAEEIKAKNYSFSAGQYFEVKIEYTDITPQEFEDKMKSFENNLSELFKESKALEIEIQNNLKGLRYE